MKLKLFIPLIFFLSFIPVRPALAVRIFAGERIQSDATYGSGLWGDPKPGWFLGVGFRFTTHPLW